MLQRCATLGLTAALLATTAAADTKILQESHQDAFTVMGHSQPASDVDRVMWMAKDRLRVDEGNSSFIVRLDSSTLFVIDHESRSVSSIQLPVDIGALLPPGMAEQMRAMMQFDITVAPTDEFKAVGSWKARRWNMTMSSPMVTISSALWATTELDIDRAAYDELTRQIVSLQPGMEGLVEKLRAVDGFVVETQSVTRMSGSSEVGVTRSERTVSVDTAQPPAGTYDPPADYEQRPFNLMAALQQQ
jgi:hypothetical protein